MGDRIFLRGIHVFARHGVLEEEARLGQRFEIDIDCWLDMATYAPADDYAGAVGYQEVFEAAREIAEGGRFALIEALAEAIASALLERFAKLEAVRVEIRKPSAPIPGILAYAGVDITRRRGG